MKPTVYILFLAILSGCKHDIQRQTLKGQWWSCNPSLGYSEILIADTTIHYLNTQSIHSYPTVYKAGTPDKIVFDNGFISLINENTALIKTKYGTNDTIFRLKEDVSNYYDFDCSENLSRSDFNRILEYEFLIRSVKNDKTCNPTLPNQINQPPAEVLDFDDLITLKKPSTVYDIDYDFDFVCQTNKDLIKKSDNITFNRDSTRFLITFQRKDLCNNDFRADPIFFKNGELKIHLFNYPSFCTDSCLIDFYVLVENYENFEIKNWEVIEHK